MGPDDLAFAKIHKSVVPMTAEDFRADVEQALQKAVAGGADPDELDAVLDAMSQRVEELRVLRGDG